jgi:hypothetical protein
MRIYIQIARGLTRSARCGNLAFELADEGAENPIMDAAFKG